MRYTMEMAFPDEASAKFPGAAQQAIRIATDVYIEQIVQDGD